MKDHFKEIGILASKYHQIHAKNRRIADLTQRIRKEQIRKGELADQVEKEYKDVQRLETQPLISLFNQVLRSRKEQIEKERQEYLMAIMEYDECCQHIELLNYEKELIENSLDDEKEVISDIESNLEMLEIAELRDKGSVLNRYKELLTDVKALAKLQIEIDEALDVINNIQEHFRIMINQINEAQDLNNWGKFYKEIQEARKLRKSYIDQAHTHIHLIKNLFGVLKAELQDVKDMKEYFKQSEVLIRGFNVAYYDHLIDDWVNDSNLMDTLSSTMAASASINQLEAGLRTVLSSIKVEHVKLENRREKLLKHLN